MQHINFEVEDQDSLRDSLEKRYGGPASQQILDEIEKAQKGEIDLPTDYMEIKELSELMEKFRAQAVNLIWQLKVWRKKEQSRATKTYIALEGEFLAKQVRESVYLYRQVKSHYYASYKAAMAKITGGNVSCPYEPYQGYQGFERDRRQAA